MLRGISLTALLVMSLAAVSSAAPLNLSQDWPDMQANPIDNVTYNATTDTLTATGWVNQFTLSDGVTSYTFTAEFSLTAVIDGSGNFVSGSLSAVNAYDAVPALGIAVGDAVLTAALTEFGFDGTKTGLNAVFEFRGTTTGGKLADDLGPNVAMVFKPSCSNFAGFGTNFGVSQDLGVGTVDLFSVPEPGTMCLLAAGLVGVVVRRRRRA